MEGDQDQDFEKVTRKIISVITSKSFLHTFFASLFSVVIILIIGIGIMWHYRANVFDFFAREYMQEVQNGSYNGADNINNGGTERQQAIFSDERFVIEAVKKTNPAVVSIVITKNVSVNQNNPFGDLFPGIPFNIPFNKKGTIPQEIGGGSGFFVSSDGLIVTNKHVVDQTGAQYSVLTNDGRKHAATVVARDPVLDIALIKISGNNFPFLSLGNSDNLQVGQSVIVIGNALGEFRNTVSVGVVSGLARSVTAGDLLGNTETLDHVIQTDAAINPGNSGGPLLDLSGNVVGVNVAIVEGSQNIGFSLPINSVKSAIESVKATGKIVRPYLGIRYVPIDAELKAIDNLPVDYGVLVKSGVNKNEVAIIPGSPANKAGIVENDIILEVDGIKIDDTNTLSSLIRQKTVGSIVILKILHGGVKKNIRVTLEAAKD